MTQREQNRFDSRGRPGCAPIVPRRVRGTSLSPTQRSCIVSHAKSKRQGSRKVRTSPGRRKHLGVAELLEDRCMPTVTTAPPIGGVGNNEAHPTWGSAGVDLLRMSAIAYANANGFSPSMGGGAPTFVAGPRLVSNVVSNQTDVLFDPDPTHDNNTVNQNGLSDFGYTWGQFLDHDMDLTPTLSGKITAASWDAVTQTATITVADGLFRA